MPELPDVEVFSRSLNKLFAGKKVAAVKVVNGKKLVDKQMAFTKAIKGKTIDKIYRSGKEMRFLFTDGTLMGLHLMLTGDVKLFDKKNPHKSTIAQIHFIDGSGLALTDRMKNAKLYLDPIDKEGIDALSRTLTAAFLLEAFKKRSRQIKPLLTDQNFIRGIGNSYSDEILWAARISPWSIASAIPAPQVRKLALAIQSILKKEILNISKKYKGKINGEVKEFLMIHSKDKKVSPTGAPIIIEAKGMMKTYYTAEQVLYK